MKKTMKHAAAFAAICGAIVCAAAEQDLFKLKEPVKTTPFRQAPFEWRVSRRHDYSKTFTTKLFLVQAEFDREYMGRYKTRDNGRQTVYMTCEQALEAIKGMDAITLGMPKIVYLVGWQYNGHDSKYPALFEGCRGAARACDKDPLDSVRWLMREAKKYNTAVSLHMNLFDAYPDSPLFEEYLRADVLAKDSEGNLVHGDWGYKVNYEAEWEKGLLQKRVDRLCSLLPVAEAGTIHVDAFHNGAPVPFALPDGRHVIRKISPISPWHGGTRERDIAAKQKIVKYFDTKGIDVTTEGFDMDIGGGTEGWFPMYWWYNGRSMPLSLSAQQACGGGCALKVFGDNVNAESVFKENRDMEKAFQVFKAGFCKTTLICQYLNNFPRKALLEGRDGRIGLFEGGVRTMWKNGKLYVEKDGELLSDGCDVFIPAVWLGDGAMVVFSEKGCKARKWKIPAGVELDGNAKGWLAGPRGRTPFKNFIVADGAVEITLAPGEMALIAN